MTDFSSFRSKSSLPAESIQRFLALALLLNSRLAISLLAARFLPSCALLLLFDAFPLFSCSLLLEPQALFLLLPQALLLLGALLGLLLSQPLGLPRVVLLPCQTLSLLLLGAQPLGLGRRVNGGEVNPHGVRGRVAAAARSGTKADHCLLIVVVAWVGTVALRTAFYDALEPK